MALISLSSLFTIVFDPQDDLADRMGFLVTLVLTAVAYAFVISSYLPNLAYVWSCFLKLSTTESVWF